MKDEPIVAIVGGSLSGNKGAAAMLLAVADGVARRLPAARVRAFSPYPVQDRLSDFGGQVVSFRPADMVLTLPAAVISLLSGRRWRPRRGTPGALASADVAVDVSGVAFMDGRGLATLLYNTLVALLPWALGVPVVKAAQALGPFRNPLNRVVARMVLERVAWIGMRGEETEGYVRSLGLTNCEPAADVSFLLQLDAAAEARARALLSAEPTITLMAPSSVLDRQCRAVGIDYVARMTQLVAGLRDEGHEVLLIAHSARAGAEEGKTNDLPICREIARRSGAPLVDEELSARELRALIGQGRLLVTSRFHAMVAALATGTPVFVVGWSHKYREVLAEFGLERWSIDFREVPDAELLEGVCALDRESDLVRAAVRANLDAVLRRAERNIDAVVNAVDEVGL